MICLNASSNPKASVKGSRLNLTDEAVIIYFALNDNEPAYPAKMEYIVEITKKSIGKSCKKLKKQGVLLSKSKVAEQYGKTDYYYLNDLVKVLTYLQEHDAKGSIHVIMDTEYYQMQIPKLIDYFDNKRVLAGHNTLSSEVKEVMQISLKYSLGALYVVLGVIDCDRASARICHEYNLYQKHLTEGRFIPVSTISIAIDETRMLNKEEKIRLKNEIFSKVADDLDLRREYYSHVLDKNAISMLFEQFLFDDSRSQILAEKENKQFAFDLKKVNSLVNDMIDPKLNSTLSKDEKDRFADWPCVFSNDSSCSRLH